MFDNTSKINVIKHIYLAPSADFLSPGGSLSVMAHNLWDTNAYATVSKGPLREVRRYRRLEKKIRLLRFAIMETKKWYFEYIL